jgi:hypothetical protein
MLMAGPAATPGEEVNFKDENRENINKDIFQ